MVKREDCERTILQIIYAENSTPAAGIAMAKQCGICERWFSTIDRRLVWAIAEVAKSRDYALNMLEMAIGKGDIGTAALGWPDEWYWDVYMLRRKAIQLRKFRMHAGLQDQ